MALGLEFQGRFSEADYAEFRGNPQMIGKMRLQEALAKMTQAERADYDKKKLEAAMMDAARKAKISLYNNFNTETITLEKLKAMNPVQISHIEKFRELALTGFWPALFQEIPAREMTNFTKYRFNWGPDGKPRFVPMTLDAWLHFFGHPDRTRWVRSNSSHICGENWVKDHARDKYKYDADSARKNPNTSPAHVRAWDAKGFRCKKPKKSLWVKIRKVVVGAAAIVAAVYLGPAALAAVQNGASAMTGGLIPAAGGGAAGEGRRAGPLSP